MAVLPTRLLVSVRSAEEAEAALAGGADIIDVKEPGRGSLGMADAATIAEVIAAVAGRKPVSVALGEVVEEPTLPTLDGVTWAKAGLARLGTASWDSYLIDVGPADLVYVAYADAGRCGAPPLEAILNRPRPPGIVLDTAIKDGRGLLHWYDVKTLRQYTLRCQQAGLFIALAGSLSRNDVRLLMDQVRPDIIAVRGAACEGGHRGGWVRTEAVAALKAVIQAGSPV